MEKKNTDTLDFMKILNLVREKWYICVSLALIFAMVTSFYYIYLKENEYRAKTTIFVYNESMTAGDGGPNYNDLLTSEKLARDCEILATSNAVLNEVRANIPEIPVKVNNISVSLIAESRIITLSVRDQNPKHAAEIANNVSDILIKVAKEKMGVRDMEVIDYANAPLYPVSDNALLKTIIAAMLGVALGVVIILVIQMFNKRIMTREDVLNAFDVVILGEIPSFSLTEPEKKGGERNV